MNRTIVFFFAALLVAACAAPSPAPGKGDWKCEASTLAYWNYDGGDFVTLWFMGVPSPRQAIVVKESDDLVSGSTRNGIPFTCTRVKK